MSAGLRPYTHNEYNPGGVFDSPAGSPVHLHRKAAHQYLCGPSYINSRFARMTPSEQGVGRTTSVLSSADEVCMIVGDFGHIPHALWIMSRAILTLTGDEDCVITIYAQVVVSSLSLNMPSTHLPPPSEYSAIEGDMGISGERSI